MYEITIYEEAERPVVAQRIQTSMMQMKDNWPRFAEEVVKQGIAPAGWGITEFFVQGEFDPNNVDCELMLPVMGPIQPAEPLKAKVIPAGKVASIIHRGPHDTIGKAYEELMAYIGQQGLKPIAHSREYYLRCPHNTTDPEGLVTEIQIPVE